MVILLAGCHRAQQDRCVSLAMKISKRSENCGLYAALSKDQATKKCADIGVDERKKMIDGYLYLLDGETCGALRLRTLELAKSMMAHENMKETEDLQSEYDKSFDEEFKKSIEENRKGANK